MKTSLWQDKDKFELALKETGCPLSAFSFSALFLWHKQFDFIMESLDGNLCVFAENSLGRFMLLPPLAARPSLRCIDLAFENMAAVNKGKGITRVENVPVQGLSVFPPDDFDYYNKGYEYLYYRQDLVGLRGNLYKSKRSSLNQFCRSYPARFLPYEPGMRAECLTLYDDWAAERQMKNTDDLYRHLLTENRTVHDLVFENYQALGFVGRVAVIDGRIRAYTFGYPQNDNVFSVLLEVADVRFKGLAVYVFREFCADAEVARYPFINAMEDMMFPGLVKTKMSFHPVLLVPSYVVTRKRGRS